MGLAPKVCFLGRDNQASLLTLKKELWHLHLVEGEALCNRTRISLSRQEKRKDKKIMNMDHHEFMPWAVWVDLQAAKVNSLLLSVILLFGLGSIYSMVDGLPLSFSKCFFTLV